MTHPGTGFILSCAIFLQCSSLAFADKILLRDGRTVSGDITGETAGSVTIDASNGRFTFPRDKILTVTKETPIRNQVREIEVLLSQGNLDSAMAQMNDDSLRNELPPQSLNRMLLEQLQPVAAAVVATSATATRLVDRLAEIGNPPAELLIFAAALLVDTENNEPALNLLRQVEQNLPASLNWPPETVSALINRIADVAVRKKYGAVVALAASLANRLPLPAGSSSTNHLNLYGQIEDMIRRKNFLHATALFRPDLFLRRADLFIPLAERLIVAILASPATESSLAALESARVTLIPYVDRDLRLRCMKILVTRLLQSGRAEHAQITVDQAAAVDSDLGSTLQHLLDFQKRRAALRPDSPMDTYKLAAWGRSMGLLDESKALFSTLRTDPRFAETAELQLAVIENAQAKDKLRQLKRLFDLDEIDQLKAESAEFLRTSPPDEFVQQTRDLLQLADFQLWSGKRSSQGKAEAEYQQAERLANRREFDKALVHLNRLQLDREDTDAAKKSDALRNRIMREMAKERAGAAATSP